MGSVSVQVEYKDQHECLPLLVVQGSGSSLLGRNWLQKVFTFVSGANIDY